MSIQARVKKLENKRDAGQDRILITYPDGAARYICGNEKTDLPRGEPWPAFDRLVRVVYENAPLKNYGDMLDLHRSGDN